MTAIHYMEVSNETWGALIAQRDALLADRDRLRRIVDRAVQDIESAGYDDAEERFPWLEDARAALAQSDKGE